ncbi:ATP-dependent Clp protease ATP-binding subunit [Herpetosiphon gulosus]|uniref:Negative regulator of genetic competence ClpC/MecB n=1 Tax=Herpetosiphon gulosus TaxID=1973496 RepID=A0ABP9X538_9CHLR
MANTFERLNPNIQHIMLLAQEEARSLSHSFLGPEHLLLGLLRQNEGLAVQILHELGVFYPQTRQIIQTMITPHAHDEQTLLPAYLPLAPHTKTLLDTAAREADQLNQLQIGPEQLLLALAREAKGFVPYILARLGLHGSIVCDSLHAALHAKSTEVAPDHTADTSLLTKLGINLTEEARNGRLDPVIGRSAEIERTIQILRRRTKNNVVLIGEPGVGKTAIVEGLAQQLAHGAIPSFQKTSVWSLDVGSLLAGAIYRGQFEERLKSVIDQISDHDAILFIDELHMIVGAGASENTVDAANMLKPALARGKLRVIGATTFDEYSQHIEKDSALKRRFQPIVVQEPGIEETVTILQGIRPKYEAHHELSLSDEALYTAARLAAQYIPDLYLPGKAIDLLDEAASRVWYYRQRQLVSDDVASSAEAPTTVVCGRDVAQVLAIQTGIPLAQLFSDGLNRIEDIEQILSQRVIGQAQAIRGVTKAIQRAFAGLKTKQELIGALLFLGPSGVGKTELSKVLAEYLLGSNKALIRMDMSEYAEAHSVSRLIGAPPGYIGYDQGGQLSESVRRRPYSVVLLDNIDYAHPDVINIFIQILEEGSITDARGRYVDFRNVLLLCTANVGTELFKRQTGLGFRAELPEIDQVARYEHLKQQALDKIKASLSLDFLHRLNDVILFQPLQAEHLEVLAGLFLHDVRQMVLAHEIRLDLTSNAHTYLTDHGYDLERGVRRLRHLIQTHIVDPISNGLLHGKYRAGDELLIDCDLSGNFTLSVAQRTTSVVA